MIFRHLSGILRIHGTKQFPWKHQTRHLSKNVIDVKEEVANALHSGKPVIALESTIITHGMPYPHNLKTAASVENIVREEGVIPATIAVIGGKVKVGLSTKELEHLSKKEEPCIKTSRRDLSYVLAQGINGGTTVSGTMVIAHQVGIPIFVTGGIGGVHRGAESSMDISADLTELGRTPITVVSAGVKSILDIGRTLEYLETAGVCVASFGSRRDFPAFFVPESGYQSPYNVTDESQAAELIDAQHKLGLQSGVLIAVPIPQDNAADGQKMESAIQAALEEARTKGIMGKEVTPFILQRVNEMTEGASLSANIALVKNNARVGSRIAKKLSEIRRAKTSKTTSMYSPCTQQTDSGRIVNIALVKNNARVGSRIAKKLSEIRRAKTSKTTSMYSPCTQQTDSGRIVVVGGSIVDFYAKISSDDVELQGATYPGNVRQSFGGVGRNLADCLTRLGSNPLFISATGMDSNRTAFEAYCSHMDLSGVISLDNYNTATYCAVLRNNGELMFGIGDMEIHKQITPEYISQFDKNLASASIVVLDGNIPVESIDYVTQVCEMNQIPVWYEPTDIHKASKPFMTSAGQRLTYISPNMNELRAIYKALTNPKEARIGHSDPDSSAVDRILDEALWLSKVIIEEVPVVVVTLGKHGVMLCQKTQQKKLPVRGRRLEKSEKMTAHIFPALNPKELAPEIVSVSGAGDCLAATMIHGIVQGHDSDLCIKMGLMAARMSLKSYHAVPPTITSEELTLEKVIEWAPWQPEKVKDTYRTHK